VLTSALLLQDLRRSNFTSASLKRAKFVNSNLQGAYLIKAVRVFALCWDKLSSVSPVHQCNLACSCISTHVVPVLLRVSRC
jgi:uncharacterized protein YjbI with pentapeptide repeats